MSTTSLPQIGEPGPGTHVCCLYETAEEHRAVLTPFLRQGLERGEKVLYILDAHNAELILGYLQDDGLDVDPYLTRGQLRILSAKDAYMREGVFDSDRMIALLGAETEQAQVESYPALRVTGEMTWALREPAGSEWLIEYEAKLNEFFPGSKCLAICQYDRRRFAPALLLEVLTTHPTAILGTKVYDNFYYMPPTEFLSHDLPSATLRHWMDNLAERKRLEDQLLWSQKMETVGRLAGGVAHDFNNSLAVIQGNAELAMMEPCLNDRVKNHLQGICKASERAAKLTRQLLAFSRRQVIHPRVIDLNEVLLDADKMLRRLIGEDIELVTQPKDNLGRVKMDPAQIEQVLVNLVVNSRDAMPYGGKLTIETGNVTLDDEYARNHSGVTPGQYVMLAVTDTGLGIPEEVKAYLFEPFFTTKEAGKGTGLGLAMCYGIVKQSGGNIWVYSEPDKGTTFKVYFPKIEGEAEALPKHDEEGYLPRGTETVLVVEDDPSVRDVTARTLREQGYTVLEATTGDQALRVASEHSKKKIHLLLTDVVIPQMDGKVLADKVRAKCPDTRVIFFSGYPGEAIVHHRVLESEVVFLEKPFSVAELARKVREVLDR